VVGAVTVRGGAQRRTAVVAAVALAVVVVGAGGWLLVSAKQLDQVVVRSGVPRCSGTEVVFRRGFGPEQVPAIRMREQMVCTLPVRVVNRGDRPVDLERMVLPFMGPGGGTGARVEQFAGLAPLGPASSNDGGIDAEFRLGSTLAAGERARFEVDITFRPEGCASPGGLMTIGGMPRVVVSALGRTGEVAGGALGVIGTRDSSCDE
jgi:hypothetical protein